MSGPQILTEEHVRQICKFGQGESTCSFLIVHPKGGWGCAKGTSMEPGIWQRRTEGSLGSKGDNCSGPPDFKSISEVEAEPLPPDHVRCRQCRKTFVPSLAFDYYDSTNSTDGLCENCCFAKHFS